MDSYGGSVMNIFIRAYVERINKGDMTIEQVPETLRAEVEELLNAENPNQ